MKLDIVVCVKKHGINAVKEETFYNYRNFLLNGDVRAIHGNSGLKKPRLNTIASVGNVNKIVDKN